MYDDFALDHIIDVHYESLDEIDTYAHDLDEDYAHNTYDLVELAYKHYAWYNVHLDSHITCHTQCLSHKNVMYVSH